MSTLATLFVELDAKTTKLNSGFGRAEKKVTGFARKSGKLMGGAGKAIAAGAAAGAAGLVAFGAKGASAFLEFDSAMTESLAIMGDVSGPMRKKMEDAARAVGKTTSFSAAEAAESYFFLASAGMDAQQSVGAMPQVAKFAQAGMFDMATATDLATDAQSALGLSVKDPTKNLENLTRTTDVFVKANQLANTSVEQISKAVTNKAGPAMRQLDMDIESGAAVLSVFADAGVKGEKAGTMLSSTLKGLTENAIKNKDEFKELGLSVFDADGKMRPMTDIVKNLDESFSGLSAEQQIATLKQLGFNKQAQDGILTLLGTSEKLSEYEGKLREAGGVTEEVADKQLKSAKEQFGLLMSRIEDVAISLGAFLIPKILAFVEVAEPVFTRVVEAVQNFFEVAVGAFKGTGEATEGFAVTVGETISGLVTFVTEMWNKFGEDIIAFALNAWESIKQLISENIGKVREIITTAVEVVTLLWDKFGEDLISLAKTVWNSIRSVISGALEIIKGIFNIFAAILTGDWDRLWEGIKSVGRGAWRVIEGIVQAGWEAIKAIFRTIKTILSDIWATIWDGLKQGAVDGWERLKGWFGTLKGKVLAIFVGATRWLFNVGSNIVQGLWNGIKALWERLKNWFLEKLEWLKGLWPFSPAKHGPLRDHPPEQWGENIVKSIGKGLAMGSPALDRGMDKIAQSVAHAGMGMKPDVQGIGHPARLPVGVRTIQPEPTVLEIRTDGSKASQAIAFIIRESTRVRGNGSVQTQFGTRAAGSLR